MFQRRIGPVVVNVRYRFVEVGEARRGAVRRHDVRPAGIGCCVSDVEVVSDLQTLRLGCVCEETERDRTTTILE